MTGAAMTILSLHDVSQIVGNISGFKAGAVFDSEWGPIDETMLVNRDNVERIYGKPNPVKYGLPYPAVINALRGCSMYVRRVDKGQLYSSALVRAKLEAAKFTDANGFWIDRPDVDTVVKPSTGIAHNDLGRHVFSMYPSKRVTKDYQVPVTIVKQPKDGDVKIYVDNTTKVNVGDIITFKNTNSMTREESLSWMTYPVAALSREKVTEHYVEITGIKQDGNNLVDEEIKHFGIYFLDRGEKVTELSELATAGQPVIQLKENNAKLVEGDVVKFAGQDKEYTIQNVNETTVTLTENLEQDVADDSVIKVKVEQAVSLQAISKVESGWDAKYPTIFKVTNNDVIIEGMNVKIGENVGKVVRKYNTENMINYIEIASEYVEQELVAVGNTVLLCSETDFEHRDAFLVRAIYPGDRGNGISISITDSKYDPDNFILTVFWYGTRVEQFECSMNYKVTEQGQLFVEQVVNNRSGYIRVQVNQDMRDSEGKLIRPLNTDYYLRQPLYELTYTKVAETVESVRDGDNKITVRPEDISNITIDKPVKIGEKVYPIASIGSSVEGAAKDTLVLAENISLGMDDLPLRDRVLKVGTPISQNLAVTDKYKLTVNKVADASEYGVTINGTAYTVQTKAKASAGKKNLRDSVTGEITDKEAPLYWGKIKNKDVAVNLTFNTTTPVTKTKQIGKALVHFNDVKDFITTLVDECVKTDPLMKNQDGEIEFKGTVTAKIGDDSKTFNIELSKVEQENYGKVADGIIKEFKLDDPANLDDPSKAYTANSILTKIKDEIAVDTKASVYIDVKEDSLILTGKKGGEPVNVEVTNFLTLEKVQSFKKDKEVKPVERIQGTILPSADKGAVVTENKVKYFIIDAGANRFAGGYDNFLPTVGDYVKTMETAFSNPDLTPDLMWIMQGCINSEDYLHAIKRLCKARLDVLGAGAIPFDAQAGKGITGEMKYLDKLNMNDRTISLFTPWASYLDTTTGIKMWLAPDSFFIANMGRSAANGDEFKAPAGWNRGQVDTTEIYKIYDYTGDTGGEVGQLYDRGVNPMRYHKDKGISFWGQKTTQKTNSALDRINTNMVTIAIFKQLRTYLDNQTFEFNDAPTRALHEDNMNNAMRVYKERGAIEGYAVRCDESNNPQQVVANHELYIDVMFWGKYSSERQYGRLAVAADGSVSISQLSL